MTCIYDNDSVTAFGQTEALHSPLQVELLAQQIARQAVFRPLDLQMRREGLYGALFQKALLQAHRVADLLLSEAADYGCQIGKNALENSRLPFCRGLEAKGSLQGSAALIIGAGPSLRQSAPFLRGAREKAFVFAAGTAASLLEEEPDFVGAVDREKPLTAFTDAILCTQLRAHPQSWATHEKRWVFPDSNAAWLDWILGESSPFESGWTVANFLTAVAVLAGCDPIVFVGTDFCYENGKKYPGSEPLDIEDIEDIETQKDWVMAASWTDEWAKRHPEHRFLNTTPRGLRKQDADLSDVLASLQKRNPANLSLPLYRIDAGRWEKWRGDDALVEKTLLEPLWSIWRPVFEREGGDLTLHKELFFSRVKEEHQHAYESSF